MNIDYKEIALASNRRIEQLAKIEARLRELPQHLRDLLPGLDALVELSNDVQRLDVETRRHLPDAVTYHLSYLRTYAQNLHGSLATHGNPLIAAIEPAPNSISED
jgi:hypothetical protein